MTAPLPQLFLDNGQLVPVSVAPEVQDNLWTQDTQYTLPLLYNPTTDRAHWVGVIHPVTGRDLGEGQLGLLTIQDFSTPEPQASFKTFGMSDVMQCQDVADKTVVGMREKFPEITLTSTRISGLSGLETPERLAIWAEQSHPLADPPLTNPLVFNLGNSDPAMPLTPTTFYHHAPTDTALGVGLHHSGHPNDPAQVWLLKIAGSQTAQPEYSLTEYSQDDWHECQTIAQSVANHLADEPALTRQLGRVQGLTQFEHIPSVPLDQREYLRPDLTDARTVARDLLSLPSLETPMATTKTYESGYEPNEAVPPPNDPKGYRSPAEEAPTATSNLVISGSRDWNMPEGEPNDGRWGKLNGYVNAIVERAQEENMRIIVGDNPQGVDWAVVNACDKQGVECRVYGTGRDPRNPKVGVSEHCQYVQVQKEDVETIHNGGANHEPLSERHLRLLEYTARDERMVEAAGENGRVLCIWNGDSGGTKHTFDYAGETGHKADLAEWDGKRFAITGRTYEMPSAGLSSPTPVAPSDEVPATEPSPVPTPDPTVTEINNALSDDPTYAQFVTATTLEPANPPLVLPDQPVNLETALAEACIITDLPAPTPAPFTLPEVALTRLGLAANPHQPATEELTVYYDPQKDIGLWIGVVEGEREEDPAQACVIAVKNLRTELPEASAAEVVSGSSETCHATAQTLVDLLQEGPNLDRFMGVVEGISRQSGTYSAWNTDAGVRLPNATSDELRTQFYNHPALDL